MRSSVTRATRGIIFRLTLGLLLGLLLLAPQAWGQALPTDLLGANLRDIAIANPADFSFAVFGDNRDDAGRFDTLISSVSRDPTIAFSINLGDLVNHADPGLYSYFFGQVRNLVKPLLTVIGNHELSPAPYGRELYADIFGPSVGPFYYSFHFGQYYFVVLDDGGDTAPDPTQQAWLVAELQKAQGYKYRLVFLHIPLYDPSGAGTHCLPKADADKLLATLKKYKVTQVFAGHLHGYFQGSWAGIHYLVSGGAGAPLEGTNPAHYFYHYLKVHATNRGFDVTINKF